MTQQEKDNIRRSLAEYTDRYPSQNRAAASLKGISAPTLSAILNGKYDLISDDMFRNIMAQISGGTRAGWQIVETRPFQEMQMALADAQDHKKVRWITGDAGCGKTTGATHYAALNREVFVILCDEDMRKGDFVRTIARKIGLKSAGMRIRDILDAAIDMINRMDNPLLVFDEGDKLNDNVFHYFINLYNRLEGQCGIVFMSTSYIQHRIERGVSANRKGYNEIYSRIGRRFFELEPVSPTDVAAICSANGINGTAAISKVIRDTEETDYDLRCVRGAIHRAKRVADAS